MAWTQAAYGHERCPEALRLTEAVELGRETVAFDPRNADFHRALGMALYRTGAHEEAREAFLRSLELRTQEDAFSLLGLAMAQEALANTARASELFERGRERARETFPQHPGLILLQNEAEGLLTG